MTRAGEPLPEPLAEAALLRADGSRVRFAELVAAGPKLVLFLRHFGCIACAEQLADLAPRLAEIAALGVGVVLVGSGPPAHFAAFLARNGLDDAPVVLVSDPTLAAFRAAGLVRSFWATWGPTATADFVRALAGGHRPRPTDGDLFQQGGALLVNDGRLVYAHANEHLGGHADPADLVDAALRLAAARSKASV